MSRKQPARGPLEEARDVLAGRLRLGVDELFDLIHAVNPTPGMAGRERTPAKPRDAAATEHRYQLKSQLQSLLVRAHPDELQVTAEEDGTVAIAHRYSRRDACHAVLDSLDEEARAWIRFQLDTAEPVVARAAAVSTRGRRGDRDHRDDRGRERPQPAQRGGGDAMERGRQALADYDFDGAIAAFRDALAGSRGVAPARALLEVLVEQLAQDEEALALEATLELGTAARQDHEVRGLLALAAARTGDGDRARRWLMDTTGPRAAEAWCVLVRAALERSALDDAERGLHTIEVCDAACPSLVELRAALTARRAEARRPDEEALQAALAAGDEVAAEARARAIVARWPDSAVAGRALADIDRRRRQAVADAAIAAAHDALTRGDVARARELAARAAAHGADTRELVAHIDEADRDARAARDRAAVERVCRLLREGEDDDDDDDAKRCGLAAYCELGAELRTRVRERVADPLLAWLDLIAPPGRPTSSGPGRDAAAHAAMGLRDAVAAARAGDPDRALALLDAHATLLSDVRDARALRTRVRDAITTNRRDAAADVVNRASAAWRAGDIATAEQTLATLDRRAAAPEVRDAAEQLEAALCRRRENAARDAHIEALVESGELVAAARELEARLALAADDDAGGDAAPGATAAARVEERLAGVRTRIRETWNVRTTTLVSLDPSALGDVLGTLPFHHTVEPWATADGHLVLAAVHDRHVFVVAAELATATAVAHHIETPVPLGRDASRCVDGDRLWIGGDEQVLSLDWRTGDVLRWDSLRATFAPGEVVEQVLFVPSARTLWLETSCNRTDFELRVIDLDDWRVIRTLGSARFMTSVPGLADSIAALDHDGGAFLYAGRGGVVGQVVELGRKRVSALVPHPCTKGLLAIAALSSDHDDAGREADAGPSDGDEGAAPSTAQATDELSLVEVVPGNRRRSLLLPGTHPDCTALIVTMREAGMAAIYDIGERGPELAVVSVGTRELETMYRVEAPDDLALVHDPTSARAFVVWESEGIHIRELDGAPPPFTEVGKRVLLPAVAPHFLCEPYEKSVLTTVDDALRAAHWDEVRTRLEALELDDAPAPVREHYHHLLGLAHARTGQHGRAREIWQAGRTHESSNRFFSCQLAACIDMVEDVRVLLDDGGDSVVRQLRYAITAADIARERGDVRAVRAALDVRPVYRLRERQSLARLAEAWLETTVADDGRTWFTKAQALAQFVAAADSHERDLPIPGAWDDDRIAAVTARARAWLTSRRMSLAPRS